MKIFHTLFCCLTLLTVTPHATAMDQVQQQVCTQCATLTQAARNACPTCMKRFLEAAGQQAYTLLNTGGPDSPYQQFITNHFGSESHNVQACNALLEPFEQLATGLSDGEEEEEQEEACARKKRPSAASHKRQRSPQNKKEEEAEA